MNAQIEEHHIDLTIGGRVEIAVYSKDSHIRSQAEDARQSADEFFGTLRDEGIIGEKPPERLTDDPSGN